MSTKMNLTRLAARFFTPQIERPLPAVVPMQRNLVPAQSTELTPPRQMFESDYDSEPVIIDVPPLPVATSAATLSNYLRIGRRYHPLCRHAFVEKQVVGYYAYERQLTYRTCAVAAAYAGAFGPAVIENPEFSYSMAVWRLSQKVGYDLDARPVQGPTGRCQPVAEEMMQLVDENYWNREGLVEWLESLDL